jgi:carbamoyltransferase
VILTVYHSKLLKRPKRFRPFAPAICHTRAHQIFNLEPGESVPFMMQIVDVREAYRSRLPGVTHVDGTARVQTVRPDTQPLWHRAPAAARAHR